MILDYMFTFNGRQPPVKDFGSFKKKLDQKLSKAILEWKKWQLRDLRRTARTLMARAGVSRDIAELCLGHQLGNIERTYNRYTYVAHKRDAFERLAKTLNASSIHRRLMRR